LLRLAAAPAIASQRVGATRDPLAPLRKRFAFVAGNNEKPEAIFRSGLF